MTINIMLNLLWLDLDSGGLSVILKDVDKNNESKLPHVPGDSEDSD